MIVIPNSNVIGAEEERVSVELFADNAWHILEEIPATGIYTWQNKRYNIDTFAGKDNIRIRFRANGNSVGATLNWFLDNVELTDTNNMFIEEDPLDISANYVKEDNKVHVQWSDPRGFVSLRYSILDNPGDMVSSVGNAGEPIIAVNKYTAEDLTAFEDYKLTSISFLRGMNPNASNVGEPTFKWYVSQGEEQLFDQEVGSTTAGEWKTITLDNPVTIDNTKPLYYGVEVTQHNSQDWPLATGYVWKEVAVNGILEYYGTAIADGRANLFSTDGGSTWDKLSNHLDDPQIFLLRATLAKDPAVEKKARFMGYRVFRDGINMLGTGSLTTLNNYTDTLPVSGTNCYKIHAFYTTGNASPGAEACATIEIISNEQAKQTDGGGLKVYPSFIQNGETVTVETGNENGGTLRIYDALGKTVKSVAVKGGRISVKMDVADGVYLFQLNGNKTAKIIVK
jgi:hypothetical protein